MEFDAKLIVKVSCHITKYSQMRWKGQSVERDKKVSNEVKGGLGYYEGK